MAAYMVLTLTNDENYVWFTHKQPGKEEFRFNI